VIEQTGVRDATLVGYSMGGGEVVRYFSRHNGRHVVKAGLVGAARRIPASACGRKTVRRPDGAEAGLPCRGLTPVLQ
jgi:pimeloyl-ACP methyl ester carboxylesterase